MTIHVWTDLLQDLALLALAFGVIRNAMNIRDVREGEAPKSLRPESSSRAQNLWCVQHDSPMTEPICDHAKQMANEGRFAGMKCIGRPLNAGSPYLRRIP